MSRVIAFLLKLADPVARCAQLTRDPARRVVVGPARPSRNPHGRPKAPVDLPSEEIERKYQAALAHIKATQPFSLQLFRGGSSLSTGAAWPTWLGPKQV